MAEQQHTQEEYGLRPEAAEYPMMLVLSFAYPCNALCPHCPYTNSNIRKEYRDAPFMSEAIFKKIADESGPFGAYLRISGGGEPMLHPKATELLVYAKATGCKIGLITNGSKFHEENSRALLQANIDMIEFSVDACDPEKYAVVREGLEWDELVANVERMVRLRKELNSTSKLICSAVVQKGIDADAVERFWVRGKGLDYIIKRKFLTWGTNTTLDGGRSADPTAYLEAGDTPCPFIFERLNIDSRGNVMVCGYDISANTRMGNVVTESIRDIWHGRGFQFYREKHLAGKGNDIPLCRGCPDWKYRSWTHNYWKVIKNAETVRQSKFAELDIHEDFQTIVDITSQAQ
jgi:MoaA/NifB/PqqE/SkfB family radical SAM enzyme